MKSDPTLELRQIAPLMMPEDEDDMRYKPLFWLKNRAWDRAHNFSQKMYLEKLKEAFVNQSMLNKNLSWFFETPFLPPRMCLRKSGVKQKMKNCTYSSFVAQL